MPSLVSTWPTRKSQDLRASERVLLALASRLTKGRHVIEGREPGPSAVLEVRRTRLLRRLLVGGTLGFAEAYIDGDCDTPDLRAFLALATANEESLLSELTGHPLSAAARRLWHAMRPNSRRGSRRNIAYHYDLGNDFYARWLDPGMAYSSAVFASDDQRLPEAQSNKYRLMAEAADLRPGHNILEIGCGWGGFAEWAARERDCRVTAITISDEQFAYAAQRIQHAGLADRVEIERRDYRDVEGQFDRIVSIEMLEAVGERYWPEFFGRLRDRLAPDGVAALQVITIADALFERYRRGTDFIQRHVFPGGMLPSLTALQAQCRDSGLNWMGARGYGPHYARTLTHWRATFEAAWPGIATLGFDERFRRMWRYYLAYCEVGFASGRIDVQQFAVTKA
jgi:cyclopropane-fatty-acyl-phospholipid synthase